MKFYNVKDDYIRFLRGYDSKVAANKMESRPYVGIVLEVDGIKYILGERMYLYGKRAYALGYDADLGQEP
ncbi:MAG: type III toxin-antitoxin system ToxN/AbiQ family toxin [Clostridiales bacterium]|nr:type III toxin-antitoxin system ToxN/AbiQ family toxin [Clostridiales bacterium]